MATDSPFEPTVLGAMWRYRWLVTLIVLVVTAAGIAYSLSRPVQYEAAATVVVQDPAAGSLFDLGQAEPPQRYVANQATILESTLVAELARELLEAEGFDASSIIVLRLAWSTNRDDIRVVVAADGPEAAVATANAVVDAYAVIKQQTVAGNFVAAIELLDESAAGLGVELAAVQQEIDAVVADDPASTVLLEQYGAALVRLGELQAQLPDTSGAALDVLRARLDDVLQQLQTMQLVTNLESQQPELVALLEEQQLLLARRSDVVGRGDELAVEARMEGTGIVLSSPAIDAVEVGAVLSRTLAVGVIIGALLAAGVAYVLALRRRRFSDAGQPESVLEARLLATVPNFRDEKVRGDLPGLTDPASAAAEAFRFVAGALRVSDPTASGDAAIYAVVSGQTGDGKSVVVANTVLAAARTGSRVLAVDADFASQRLTMLLSAGDAEIPLSYQTAVGLTDLTGPVSVPLSDVVKRIRIGDDTEFDLLSKGSGQASASDFFSSTQIQDLFEAIRANYDIVIIDTPPLTKVAYAGDLVRRANGALVVVRHGGNVAPVEEVAERLAVLEVAVAGYVYNRAPLADEVGRSEGSLKDMLGTRSSSTT